MLYKELAEIFGVIQHRRLSPQEILQILCLRPLASLHSRAIFYSRLDLDGRIYPTTAFGIELGDNGIPPQGFDIYEPSPMADAVRNSQFVFINTLPRWPEPYRRSFAVKLPHDLKTMITWPIHDEAICRGTLTLLSTERLEKNDDIIGFLEAVGAIIAPLFIQNNHQRPPNHGESSIVAAEHDGRVSDGTALTERQELVLQMIADGRTNGDIADLLGYSESLIRQETIRIYAKLGCSGRAEAAQIYRARHSELLGTGIPKQRGA